MYRSGITTPSPSTLIWYPTPGTCPRPSYSSPFLKVYRLSSFTMQTSRRIITCQSSHLILTRTITIAPFAWFCAGLRPLRLLVEVAPVDLIVLLVFQIPDPGDPVPVDDHLIAVGQLQAGHSARMTGYRAVDLIPGVIETHRHDLAKSGKRLGHIGSPLSFGVGGGAAAPPIYLMV